MERLPNELLQQILLPDHHRVSLQVADNDNSAHLVGFADHWRVSWAHRRVCRTFNDVLRPVLLANLKRETFAILRIVASPDTAAPHALVRPREPSATVCSLAMFLTAWWMSERQTVSFLRCMYLALGGEEDWPVDGFGAADAERLVFRALGEGVDAGGDGSVEAGTCGCAQGGEGHRRCVVFLRALIKQGMPILDHAKAMLMVGTDDSKRFPGRTSANIREHRADKIKDHVFSRINGLA